MSAIVVKRTVVPTGSAQPDIASLRRIVPGDIFVKDSATDTTETDTEDHIAIVLSVPSDPYSITDAKEYMEQIILIEGEYTNLIQSVIKVISIGDYNLGFVKTGRKIYLGFTVEPVGDVDGVPLNCQSWAVRRLK